MQLPIPTFPVALAEDCLLANIYAPMESPPAPLPVIVWIHGGGFQIGTSNNYNGTFMAGGATDPVIVVAINYRLNIFGFFFLDDADVSGINVGVQDQRFALRWVQENIGNFGGDPRRVTIMGESAGSCSGFFHLVEKPSWPYFHRVVAESGGPGIWPGTAESVAAFRSYASSLGCSTLECMRSLDARQIVPSFVMGQSPFVYVWDPRIVPFQPQVMVSLNLTRFRTPVLVGNNALESSFFSFLYMNYSLAPPTRGQYDSIHSSVFAIYGQDVQRVVSRYYPFDATNATQNFLNVGAPISDFVVVCASQLAARAMYKAAPGSVFRYLWTVAPKNFVLTMAGLGATHTSEIPFFLGTGAVFGFSFTAEEGRVAERVSGIVRQFAWSGKAPWNPADTMVFGLNSSQAAPYYNELCDEWAGALNPPVV